DVRPQRISDFAAKHPDGGAIHGERTVNGVVQQGPERLPVAIVEILVQARGLVLLLAQSSGACPSPLHDIRNKTAQCTADSGSERSLRPRAEAPSQCPEDNAACLLFPGQIAQRLPVSVQGDPGPLSGRHIPDKAGTEECERKCCRCGPVGKSRLSRL